MAGFRGKVLRTALSAAYALSPGLPMSAQQPAVNLPVYTFEVVSIKPHNPADRTGGYRMSGDNYQTANASLKSLIVSAYQLKMEDFVFGVSGPLADARFDVQTKLDADTAAAIKKLPREDRRATQAGMMRIMLEDRFKLKAHRETRELPIFALVVAKSGPKLKTADAHDTYPNGIKGADGIGRAGMMQFSPESMRAQGVPLIYLAGNLQHQPGVGRLVLDKTGLPGNYDFELHWFNEDLHRNDLTASGPSLFTALEEQLGLKLESTKAPVDTVVVDHAEKPSED